MTNTTNATFELGGVPVTGAHFEQVVLTPERARHWLRFNTMNRSIRWNHVAFLQREIALGRFYLNYADPIVFSQPPYTMLNGQHRTLAVSRGTTAISVVAVRGVPIELFEKMNLGVPWSNADRLRARKIGNSAITAAIARSALSGLSGKNVHQSDVVRFSERANAVIARYIPLSHRPCFGAPVAAAMVRAELAGFLDVFDFAERCRKMVDLKEGDPALALTNALMKRPLARTKYGYAVSAIRAVNDGRGLRTCKVPGKDLPDVAGEYWQER